MNEMKINVFYDGEETLFDMVIDSLEIYVQNNKFVHMTD